MKKHKQEAGWKRIVAGGLVGAGLAVLLCFAGAALTEKEVLPENAMNGWCLAALAFSAAGAAAVSMDGSRNLLPALCGSGAVALLLAAGKLLAFPGGGGGLAKNAACCLLAGAAVGFLKGRTSKRKSYCVQRR